MLLVAFDIVHSEISVNIGRLKTPYVHGLSSKVVIFYPICRCQRTSDGTVPAVRRILGSRTSKIVSDGSCPLLKADEKIVLSSGVTRSGGPDWIRTSDPLLIKEVL